MIGLIGLNHTTAPVEIREQFVLEEEESVRFIRDVRETLSVEEAVVLSTCNRTEIYFQTKVPSLDTLFEKFVEKLKSLKEINGNIRDHFYMHRDSHAVRHLLSVAAGLNSMVLGENQVLGQVKDAYRISSTRGLTGTVLNRLFHKAFEAGKRTRAETALNEGASSISYAAVELAVRIFGKIDDSPVLLIGAGETGELVLQSLVHRGCDSIFVTNRTFQRAREVAEKHCAEPCDYEQLNGYLEYCNIVLVSTGSKVPIITKEMMSPVVEKRNGRPLFLIDLSVPRNVEGGVKELEEVFLYNIDDLEEVVGKNYEKRQSEIEKAEEIIAGIQHDFFSWLKTLHLAPTIERLNTKIDSLYLKELTGLKNKLPENEYAKVEEFARFMKGKYLGLIVKNLKLLSNKGESVKYIDLLHNLFELRGDDGAE